jgi:hypothetical protein
MGVPSGNLVVDGIMDWLGETPAERGVRSKGNFCKSAEFDSSAGGRLQAHNRLTSSRLTVSKPGVGNTTLRLAAHLSPNGICLFGTVYGKHGRLCRRLTTQLRNLTHIC